jgi:predicted dehydrogenase
MVRVALLEANHWHVPLYLDALRQPGIEIAAISDPEGGIGQRVGRELGARLYASSEALLRSEAIDFAFAFGRPLDMPRIGEALVAAGIPFALEKPCGARHQDVARLCERASAARHFVAVPFIFRFSPLVELLRSLSADGPADYRHLSFRFIGGPPSRYPAMGCPWMLDPAIAGGGPTINLGIHFIDLIHCLAGERTGTASAAMTSGVNGGSIEDFAALTLRTPAGVIATVEAGYTFPGAADEQREVQFTIRSRRHYVRSAAGGVSVRRVEAPGAGSEFWPIALDTDALYPPFALAALADWRAGRPPRSGLAEAEAAMAVVDAAYRSAREGGAVIRI